MRPTDWKPRTRIAASVAIAAGVAAVAALGWKVANPAGTDARLTVHFTCDSFGRLEPCGCFTGQHGGLTRLRTWLERNRKPGTTLKLDVGGAIAGTQDYDLIQYRYLTRAYERMGYSALNVGGREAGINATRLATLAKESPVPLISASLVHADNNELLLPPSRIVKVDGLRIGILGVVSPDSVPNPGTGLRILNLNEAINRQLPELREQSDLIILLAFAKESEMRRLARDYFEFALILGGDVEGPSQELIHENDSILLFTTNQARTVGTLSAKLSQGPRRHLLEPKHSIDLLWEDIPQDPELLAMVREFRNEIRHTRLDVDDPHAVNPDAIPGVAPTAHYVGSASCASCHPKAHEIWSKSGHAKAFETLVKKGADADPHCIACHTVGFGKPGGYRREMGKEQLTDVSCESCHGPASEHLERYQNGKANSFRFRPLGPGDCKTCHYGEFSRPFEWDLFWPGIRHDNEAPASKPAENQ